MSIGSLSNFQKAKLFVHRQKSWLTSVISGLQGTVSSLFPVASVILPATGVSIVCQWLVSNCRHEYSPGIVGDFLKVFRSILDPSGKAEIRCILWIPEGEYLYARSNYVPSNSRPTISKMHTSKGAIGLAYRKKKIICHIYDKSTPVKDELEDDWSFTTDEAATIDTTRICHLAIPVIDVNNDVIAVIYCDSGDQQTDQLFKDQAVLAYNAAQMWAPLNDSMRASG